MDEPASSLALPPAYTPPTFQPFSRSRPTSNHGPLQSARPAHPYSALNLPAAYFVLKSKGGLALDLTSQKTEPGSPIGAYPIKLPIVARGSSSLNNITNNQLFFLDWDGHLCSASANRPIDVVDFQLSLQAAGPSPIFPIASRASHPLPRFALDPITATLHVKFDYEPTFADPPNSTATREQWSELDWIVEIVPSRVRRVDNSGAGVMNGLFSGIGEKFGLFGLAAPLPSPPITTPADRPRSPARSSTSANTLHIDHSDDSGDESDTDSNPFRALRVIQLPSDWREKFPAAALSRSSYNPAGLGENEAAELRKWRRRQWICNAVSVEAIPGPASPVLQRNQIPASSSGNAAGMRPLRLQTASTFALPSTVPPSTSPSRTSNPSPIPTPIPATVPTKESRWSALSLPFSLGSTPAPSTSPSKPSFLQSNQAALPPTPSPPLPQLPEEDNFFELIPRSLGDYDDARVVQDVEPISEEEMGRSSEVVEQEEEVISFEKRLAVLPVLESAEERAPRTDDLPSDGLAEVQQEEIDVASVEDKLSILSVPESIEEPTMTRGDVGDDAAVAGADLAEEAQEEEENVSSKKEAVIAV